MSCSSLSSTFCNQHLSLAPTKISWLQQNCWRWWWSWIFFRNNVESAMMLAKLLTVTMIVNCICLKKKKMCNVAGKPLLGGFFLFLLLKFYWNILKNLTGKPLLCCIFIFFFFNLSKFCLKSDWQAFIVLNFHLFF